MFSSLTREFDGTTKLKRLSLRQSDSLSHPSDESSSPKMARLILEDVTLTRDGTLITAQVRFRIRRISQTNLAHLNSPELLFSSQVLIQVLFGNQFKGH